MISRVGKDSSDGQALAMQAQSPKFDFQLSMVACVYNPGAGEVKTWIPRAYGLPA